MFIMNDYQTAEDIPARYLQYTRDTNGAPVYRDDDDGDYPLSPMRYWKSRTLRAFVPMATIHFERWARRRANGEHPADLARQIEAMTLAALRRGE